MSTEGGTKAVVAALTANTGIAITKFAAFALTGVAAVWRAPALLGVIAVPVASVPVRAVVDGASGPALIGVLGWTGRAQLAYGALFALGLAIGG